MNTSRRTQPASRIFDVMTIARAFGPKFGRATGFVQRANRIRLSHASLRAMPDHMLKDIGITRCEISFPMRFPKAKSAGWLRRSGE
ncbi:DUF1127 domain-containing protein [Mesorhizobium sp. LHD-90]|uniref:DUF1127 domain-containing protein n=1 Tax=Mesorhizobium sp. LHD-90 TaxID=3071414 RepID=UPI0027E0D00B|nr:DUF1127 domain-containing protein [Mesorhizobium sp. LHD-90]MDQ6436871.1 DUF1127 domain-containing protein [Mesorhizobium sp. LHD-90]